MDRKNIKALGLLSGGLDSTIAVKMMVNLGYDVTLLNFMSPFCTCTKKSNGCKSAAHQVAAELNVKIKTRFMGDEYLQMVRNPMHGYGKGMNPCIDCRIMMFRHAGRVMREVGAKFIFTGEVIGQRPMSQMKNRLNQIENESGLKGLIVRPLSAATMKPTIPEKRGWVNREEMLAISGRSRRRQIELGRDMGIADENLCSSGGCMLTDTHFATRFKDLINHAPQVSVKEARMLRVGRHFRLADNCKVIVGRNREENEKLERMADEGNTLMHVRDFKGPCVVLVGDIKNGHGATAGQIAARYSDAPNDINVEVEMVEVGSDRKSSVAVRAIKDDMLDKIRI